MKFKEKRPLYLLKEVAEILRGEKGCAWDKKQTSKTLKPYLLEEVYELCEAIDNEDQENMKEELGDYMYQAFAHAQIADENKNFSIDDVAQAMVDKLIRRHPHVFGNISGNNEKEISLRWEKIKKEEKKERTSILEGVPKALPALVKAYRVQEKVSKVGFDWSKGEEVLAKIEEEVLEFKEALAVKKREEIEEEAGDLLFSLVNFLRFYKINSEDVLQRATIKFSRRFKKIEEKIREQGKEFENFSLAELDQFWEEVKSEER